MYAHLAITGDLSQHKNWSERLEKYEQSNEIEATSDAQRQALLRNDDAWKKIRMASWEGANWTALVGSVGTAWLMYEYAVGWGFGWLAAASFALPMPIAWAVSRKTFQKGAARIMGFLGRKPTTTKRMIGLMEGTAWSAGAGFAFGFTLVFLQGLISWFMTPAPTLWLELYYDVVNALWCGAVAGTLSVGLGPLLCRKAPADAALPEGEKEWLSLPEAP